MTSRTRAFLATAFAAALSVSVVACASPAAEDEPSTIRIGVTPEQFAGFDLTTASRFPLSVNVVYESLFTSYLEFGGYQPSLATEYELSDDWKAVTLTLRDDVRFSDGERFTAEGLKTYLEGMAANDSWWFLGQWDRAPRTLTAVDETTLVIASDEPMPPNHRSFLQELFDLPIASPRVLDDLEAAAAAPAGSGPYVLDTFTQDVEVSFVRNENHWNAEAFPFDSVELSVFADQIAASNALTAGQIDAAKIPASLADEAESQGLSIADAPRRPEHDAQRSRP